MSRRLWWLNLMLAGLVGLLVWQLRLRRQETMAAERGVLEKPAHPQAVLAPPSPPPVQPVAPAQYIDTVQNMLFSKDRNPNVIVEVPKPQPPPPPPPPPPPMPPLPNYYGQLHFGGPPVIELKMSSGKDAQAQKGYEAGEKIGDFTVVAFDRDTATFEWNGQEIVRNLSDLKPKEAQAPAAQAAPQAPVLARPSQGQAGGAPSGGLISIGSNDASAAPAQPDVLGPDVGGGFYGCQPGDTTPSGTVVNGYLKTSAPGLMGTTCRWEKVK